jgi:penicillin-binding protein 1A
VTTTLDPGLQRIAREAIGSVLPYREDGPTAAMVVIDAQHDPGAVVAMVGGPNYHKNQFNLATQGERQPGSSFKPFVLATALKEGISPSTILTSSKQVTINADGRLWPVNNYEGEALGPISLTEAIAYSDNTVFSQLTAIVGPRNVRDTAHDLGVLTKQQPYFSIGLGTEPATPLDMARAYTAFADGGYRIDGSIFGDEPRAVDSVTVGGKTTQNKPVPRQKLTPDQAATIDQLLQGVVRYGTGTAAALPGWQVAGKTGTTENYGDAWFVGFTPQIVAAVWVGYPDKLVPMTTEFHGRPVAGGTFPALIWKAFMEKALPYLKLTPASFPSPQTGWAAPVTVVNRGGLLERDDGVCTNTYSIEFYGGVGPKRLATCKKNEVEVPDVVGQSLAAAKTRLAGQPLEAAVVYKPAKTGDRVGYVVGQFPRGGTASAHDKITLISEKSLTGVVPLVVGLPLAEARARLARVHLKVKIVGGSHGKVVKQSLPASTATRPGGEIVVTVRA